MIPMPYIVVNVVLEIFSFVLFCITGAALLSQFPWANRYLPAPVRTSRALSFVALGLVLSILTSAVLLVLGKGKSVVLSAPWVFEWLFFAGLANAVVLTYRFLDGRYLINMPRVPRRVLIALCAVIMPSVALLAVVIGVFGLFTIR